MKKRISLDIIKASGKVLPYSEEKLIQSLMRSGASIETARAIAEELEPKLYQKIPTKKIYRMAFGLLKKRSKKLAAKYHLKRGIMELGPSGYPFEKFFSEILKHFGYQTLINQRVKGKCVNHEIDVIAEKRDHQYMIECKYHNHPGSVCDVKIPLYIQARFKDVENSWRLAAGNINKTFQGWVATNTKFTTDAIQYGKCAGLKLVGWDYPPEKSLKNMIDDSGLFPVTCLTTLNKSEKNELLNRNIVLSRDLCESSSVLVELRLNATRIKNILEEAARLCEIKRH
jgi:hypothetical protein